MDYYANTAQTKPLSISSKSINLFFVLFFQSRFVSFSIGKKNIVFKSCLQRIFSLIDLLSNEKKCRKIKHFDFTLPIRIAIKKIEK